MERSYGAMEGVEATSFVLEIELGNAEMREPLHIAAALKRVAADVYAGHENGLIRDLNGNTVGT